MICVSFQTYHNRRRFFHFFVIEIIERKRQYIFVNFFDDRDVQNRTQLKSIKNVVE